MLRLVLGLVKGGIIGAGLGYGAFTAGLSGGWNWLTYGIIGAVVGLLVGRPVWKHLRDKSSTLWTPVLKVLVGFGVAVGLYALAAKVWGGFTVHLEPLTTGAANVVDLPFLLGGVVGAVYGGFVEVDDAEPGAAKSDKQLKA